MNYRNTRRGFTLIELLVVVLMIGILAAIAVPQYQKAVEKSRISESVQRLAQLQQAVEIYALQHPAESINLDKLDISFSDYIHPSMGFSNGRCTDKKTCVRAYSIEHTAYIGAYTEMDNGDPEYDIYANRENDGTWSKYYTSCEKDISWAGLEKLGFEEQPC